jgi:hypothetical protein
VPFAEDLAPFFDTAGFATAVTIDGASVNAIFDNAYIEAGGLGVVGLQPILTCLSSDVDDVDIGAGVVVGSTDYLVVRMEPDGTGVTTVYLTLGDASGDASVYADDYADSYA